MAKGDGSIYQLGRNKWRVSIDFGRNPITNKRERATRVVNGSKSEAKKARDQIRHEHESGLSIDGAKMTFKELATQYHNMRIASGEVGQHYIKREQCEIGILCDYIGNVPINELTTPMIEQLYVTIKADRTKKFGSYSGTTLNHMHATLKRILKKAVDYDYILRNPCDRVQAPRRDEPQRRTLTAEEGARFLQCINEAEAEAYKEMEEKEERQTRRGNLFGRESLRGLDSVGNILAVRIGLVTGMRRGEVLGLLWGCVDLERPCIHVRKSLTTYGELKTPKTKAGIRTIHIDTTTAERLRVWKEHQRIELFKIGIKQGDTTPVCCSEKGGLVDPNNFGRWWRQFCASSGFEGLKFHELRHTQATQLLANGTDVKTVQTRLGHANASLTLNWYAHAIPENDEKAAQLVGELFADKANEAPIIAVKTA